MNWIEALVLGVIQGLTEFLPVSSSGHLAISGTLFGLNGEENLAFAIIVHAATVLSTIFVLWPEVSSLFKGLFSFKRNTETQMVSKILLSVVPVCIVGLFFKEHIAALFDDNLLFIGVMLLVTAALLALSSYIKPLQKSEISFTDACLIGVAQAFAVLPGLSRSGTTIVTGLLLGNQKESVAKFSFLMVIIPVLGETVLDLKKGYFSVESLGISPWVLLCGFLAAFLTGTLACKWMIRLVKSSKLIYFAYYCIAAGLFAVIYSLVK
ncbi:MAG: undecaprenyl-diphosphate phosphatase [Tannerella sp.]|jgi:undecaprenyl-diphosphatase|nr:undecaprenyl-diphosphate phosphatase [Tannerella sp.]